MNYSKYFILLFCLVFLFTKGQEIPTSKSKKLNLRIELGIDRGIQLSKNFPILKSGEMFNLSVSKPYGPHFEAGLGLSYHNLEEEQFIPMYVFLIGKRKSGNSAFVTSSLGISKGISNKYKQSVSNSFDGGKHFSTGLGYCYSINQKISFISSVNYCIQKAEVKHYDDKRNIYTENLVFDLFIFKVGLLLK